MLRNLSGIGVLYVLLCSATATAQATDLPEAPGRRFSLGVELSAQVGRTAFSPGWSQSSDARLVGLALGYRQRLNGRLGLRAHLGTAAGEAGTGLVEDDNDRQTTDAALGAGFSLFGDATLAFGPFRRMFVGPTLGVRALFTWLDPIEDTGPRRATLPSAFTSIPIGATFGGDVGKEERYSMSVTAAVGPAFTSAGLGSSAHVIARAEVAF